MGNQSGSDALRKSTKVAIGMVAFFAAMFVVAILWVNQQTEAAMFMIVCMSFVVCFMELMSNFAIWVLGVHTSRSVESVESAIDPVHDLIEPFKEDLEKILEAKRELDSVEVDYRPLIELVKTAARHTTDPDWDWQKASELMEWGFRLMKSGISTVQIPANGNIRPPLPPMPPTKFTTNDLPEMR